MKLSYIFMFATSITCSSGCGMEEIKRHGYAIGKQQACMENNENLPNESAHDLECISTAQKEGMSYDDYQEARKEALKNSGE
jgi:hypothetical protein